ncbi:hypothetical protein K438DRAFT_1871016 [Mycena galopus ATCC 62051]|nr:hypothetical protein K438DRAFT_1871016 [Mycena galopus ATCC 62051]
MHSRQTFRSLFSPIPAALSLRTVASPLDIATSPQSRVSALRTPLLHNPLLEMSRPDALTPATSWWTYVACSSSPMLQHKTSPMLTTYLYHIPAPTVSLRLRILLFCSVNPPSQPRQLPSLKTESSPAILA